jgi:hypothetical protein
MRPLGKVLISRIHLPIQFTLISGVNALANISVSICSEAFDVQ